MLTSGGIQGNGDSGGLAGGPAISGDGWFVAFASSASNLVPDDTNGLRDIFVRDHGAFGARTRVKLSLARTRILPNGPLRVRVRNRKALLLGADSDHGPRLLRRDAARRQDDPP